jgi:LPXTG-site transpeptidase (sortase) family protein
MWRRDRNSKQVDLSDLNPVRYKKKERKPYNRIVVSSRDRMPKTKKKRMNWPFVISLIIAGIAFVLYPEFMRYTGEKEAEQLMQGFEDKMEDENEEEMDVEEEETEESSALSQEDADALSEEEVIGIIKIESIDIKYPVMEGTGEDVLCKGIGHLTETAGIGEKGNCVLCGHNGSRRGTFFTPLNTVQIGDEVELIDKRGRSHIYKIVNTKVVEPRDNSIKNTDGTEKLTLFTCAESGTKRFVCECMPFADRSVETTNRTIKER